MTLNTRLKATPSLKKADAVKVMVYPDDGRNWDTYVVSRSELVRFCWATLADLDPDEARAASAESAVDLAAMKAGFKPQRRSSHFSENIDRPERPPMVKAGGSAAEILLAFAAQNGPAETKTATRGLPGHVREVGSRTVSRFIRQGLMRRLNAGSRLSTGIYELTDLGRSEAARLSALNPCELEAA